VIRPQPEKFQLQAQVRLSGFAALTAPARRRRVNGHTLARLQPTFRPSGHNDTGCFMPQRERPVGSNTTNIAKQVGMQITAADANRCYIQQHFTRARLGICTLLNANVPNPVKKSCLDHLKFSIHLAADTGCPVSDAMRSVAQLRHRV
jgi:hypothetical protein